MALKFLPLNPWKYLMTQDNSGKFNLSVQSIYSWIFPLMSKANSSETAVQTQRGEAIWNSHCTEIKHEAHTSAFKPQFSGNVVGLSNPLLVHHALGLRQQEEIPHFCWMKLVIFFFSPAPTLPPLLTSPSFPRLQFPFICLGAACTQMYMVFWGNIFFLGKECKNFGKKKS